MQRILLTSLRRMSSVLSIVPEVDIDPDGVFKYILIKLTCKKDGQESVSQVVRGYESCPFHADINDKFTEDLQKMKEDGVLTNWGTKVLGGGRIEHDPANKYIKVYGYSQGYGKADHEVTVAILKKAYTDYEITWSNEGY